MRRSQTCNSQSKGKMKIRIIGNGLVYIIFIVTWADRMCRVDGMERVDGMDRVDRVDCLDGMGRVDRVARLRVGGGG